MTDLPYTDDDLRLEAASQYAATLRDPDFMGIGEQMTDQTWRDLNEDDFDTAQHAIDNLLGKAADVSEWAVNLGADNLQPMAEAISLDAGGNPLCRIHFAVRPDMPEEMRLALVEGIGEEIAKYV